MCSFLRQSSTSSIKDISLKITKSEKKYQVRFIPSILDLPECTGVVKVILFSMIYVYLTSTL